MKNAVNYFLLLLLSSYSFSQEYIISGTVLDSTNKPINAADIFIDGTDYYEFTDENGYFEILVEAGTYQVTIEPFGFETKTESITIINQNHSLDLGTFFKENNVTELEAAQIRVKRSKESVEALLRSRREGINLVENIGAQELSSRGVSDVQGAIAKISGVNQIGRGDQLIVRGLGDRYNNAYLNSLPLPSNDIRFKLIDLSIFKTDIVQNISVFKTFLPNYYADFAGAGFNIISKDTPNKTIFKIGLSGGFNGQTIDEEFLQLNGGKHEFWGYDNGTRRPPIILNINNTPFSTVNFGNNFEFNRLPTRTDWVPENEGTPLNFGLNLSGGTKFKLGENSSLGLFINGSFSNNYRIFESGFEGAIDAQGSFRDSLQIKRFNYSTNSTLLGTVEFKIDQSHKIRYNGLFINDSNDDLKIANGINFEGDNLFRQFGTFRQNNLFLNQIEGIHKIGNNQELTLTWGGSYSLVQDDVPDRRDTQSLIRPDGLLQFSTSTLVASNTNRFWQEARDESYATRLNISYNFSQDSGLNKTIDFGTNFTHKDFTLEQWQLNYVIGNSLSTTPFSPNQLDQLLSLENLNNRQYNLVEQVNPSRETSGSQEVYGIYAQLNYAINDEFVLNPSIRYENGEQETFYRVQGDILGGAFRNAVIDEDYILPSLVAKYSPHKNMNIRFAGSKTIVRPQFVEIAPFLFEDIIESTIGNPPLNNISTDPNNPIFAGIENSEVWNADLRWEFFPSSSELISAGIFYKNIDNPIEKVQAARASGSNEKTFINSNSANVFGAEIEIRYNLKKNLTLGITTSYTHTSSETDATTLTGTGGGVNVTNPEHNLQGASPWIVNANFSWRPKLSDWLKTTTTLDYNWQSENLYSLGAQGIQDEFQRDFHTLNLIVKNTLFKKYGLNISIKNILNDTLERYIKQNNTELTTYHYRYGLDFNIGLSYKF